MTSPPTDPRDRADSPGTSNSADLGSLSSVELGELARAALTALARRGDDAAFAELLTMNGHVGICMGEAARALAAAGSWTQVADLSGTTKQAAWSRWR